MCLITSVAVAQGAEKKEPPKKSVTEAKPAVKEPKETEPKKKAEKSKKKKKKEETPLEKDKRLAKKIREVLQFGLQKERKEAISRILMIKDKGIKEELNDLLIEMLPNEFNSEVKVKILTTMGEIKAGKGVKEMTDLLGDNSEEVRIAATYALKENKALSAKGKLIEEAKKQDMTTDSRYNEALINTLAEFDATELTAFAKEHIESTTTARTIRERLVLFLGKLSNKEAADFLIKLYNDEEEEVMIRCYAVNSLSHLGVQEVRMDIKRVLADIDSYSFKKKKRYYNLTIYSVAALVKLGDKEATPRLMASLKSDNSSVRLKAIGLLKELKDKRTIDILKYKMKYDPKENVRKAAEDALKEMGVDVETIKEEEKEGKS